jgi:hypothetical protein
LFPRGRLDVVSDAPGSRALSMGCSEGRGVSSGAFHHSAARVRRMRSLDYPSHQLIEHSLSVLHEDVGASRSSVNRTGTEWPLILGKNPLKRSRPFPSLYLPPNAAAGSRPLSRVSSLSRQGAHPNAAGQRRCLWLQPLLPAGVHPGVAVGTHRGPAAMHFPPHRQLQRRVEWRWLHRFQRGTTATPDGDRHAPGGSRRRRQCRPAGRRGGLRCYQLWAGP